MINETLCYCQNKFDTATIKQLKVVLSSFFQEDELIAAKQVLYDSAVKIIDNLPRMVKRNKSDNRIKLIS